MTPRRTLSWFSLHADAVLLTVVTLALLAGIQWNLLWLESAAGALIAFALPGWFFSRALFGERPFELEIEVLLILFVSIFLLGLEVLPLLYFQIAVTRRLAMYLALGSAWLLMLILKIRDGAFSARRSGRLPVHWPPLLAATLVPLVLLGFSLLHVRETPESYTEFRLASPLSAPAESVVLEVESHEEGVKLFNLVCQAEQGGDPTTLANFEINPGQTRLAIIAYSQDGSKTGKLRLSLDQHKGKSNYRWLEITGDDCSQLKVVIQ